MNYDPNKRQNKSPKKGFNKGQGKGQNKGQNERPNKRPDERHMPFAHRRSGDMRPSEPAPLQISPREVEAKGPAAPEVAGQVIPTHEDHLAGVQGTPASPIPQAVDAPAPADAERVVSSQQEQAGAAAPAEGVQKVAGAGKAKAAIETLEQFIEYAYGRKGQRLKLEAKVERQIAQSPRLDDAALSRLITLAAGDTLLAVPRQILLTSRDVDGYPALRAALASFVLTVMFRHAAFAGAGVQAVLRNLPEAPPSAGALAAIVEFTPAEADVKDPLKGGELHALRRNAVNLLVTWLAINRGMNSEELAALLFQVVWHPAARDLADDNARLRALTEVDQAAGVGLACLRFRQQANEARTAQEQAMREANDLRLRIAESESQRARADEQRDALRAELAALREQTTFEMAELRREHAEERTHLHHGHEQLGGRLVRRLEDAVETLQVGLSALRNKTPRVEVMLERAELVVDALKAEIKNLREE